MESDANSVSDNSAPAFIEGADYYLEDGLMILTAIYLRKRGYCCENGCRHCPYSDAEREDQSKNSSSSL